MLDAVSRGARRLLATLDGVIDLSRIGQESAAEAAEPVALMPVVAAAAADHAPSAEAEGLYLHVHDVPEAPLRPRPRPTPPRWRAPSARWWATRSALRRRAA